MSSGKIINLKKNSPPFLNPDKVPLTPEKLRELSGLHHLTDEEAREIIISIRSFARILYEFVNKKSSPCIDQQVVSIDDNSITKKQDA